jgi:hypothetical protein
MSDKTYWLLMIVLGGDKGGMIVGIYDNQKSAKDVMKKELRRTSRKKCGFFVAKARPEHIAKLQEHNLLTRDDPPQINYEWR